ncbi:hypothetical protein D0T53_08530 [Dysgonomonas sp. 216]|uniref:fasciclin domain-containing protein n=1 Tax=Dysgonomonas sp. 216 TaxID=2302934 RepID=UPI0013D5C2BB|nr:fasciclin domain-containing protein [Dysgonomonas sp. 216]NDW18954.1 hypothetical protein [Dysgonomonas sp. 216]
MNTLKKYIQKYIAMLIMAVVLFSSCDDEYKYLNELPNWLGDNIYATLENDSRFTTYVKMLNRMDESYVDVLKKTGSRTLFVPTDSAFNAFFNDNPDGYTSVDDMPTSVIKTYLTYYTLKGAFVTSNLGTSENYIRGNCLRRYTTYLRTDDIALETNLPNSSYFDKYREKGMYISTHGERTILNFTQEYFDKNEVKNDDFNFFYPEANRKAGDAFIFGARIIDGDITTQNGYIHALDKVVMPPMTMYDYIRNDDNLSVFRNLLERFCEPIYDPEATAALRASNPAIQDSVFYISFFDNDRTIIDEYGNEVTVSKIAFSPAANDGGTTSTNIGKTPSNMPAMLIPTNEAMISYLEDSFLADYGTWEDVPDDIAAKFVNTHMKLSFLNTLPSNVESFIDDVKGDSIHLTKDNLLDGKICRNGALFTINTIVGPRDFVTVVSPLYKNPNLRVLNWLINESYNNKLLKFNYYLTSLENKFTLILPVDESFEDYVDPYPYTMMGANVKAMLRFRYYENLKGVNYIYLNMAGDSIGRPSTPVYTNSNNSTYKTLRNRLKDVLDYHIVVGEIEDDQDYVQTKGGAFIKIDRTGGQIRFQGAGDIENGDYVEVLEKYDISNNIKNGTVYIVNKRIEHTLKSVYAYGVEATNASTFFDMMAQYNDPDQIFTFSDEKITFAASVKERKQTEFVPPIFENSDGVDYVIPFLGLYNYTLFAPSNAAMSKALSDGLYKSISDIEDITDDGEKMREIKRNILFLKKHFFDGGVFTSKFYQSAFETYNWPVTFTTSAKDTLTNRFYNMQVDLAGNQLLLKDMDGNNIAETMNGYTDVMTRQYKFLDSGIGSNSRIVIHMINEALPLN